MDRLLYTGYCGYTGAVEHPDTDLADMLPSMCPGATGSAYK